MKLISTAETFNLGDTSFRRKTLIDDYKILLPFLQEVNVEFEIWNNEAQSAFYKKILKKTELFDRNTDEDFAKRGRTLTNALVKIGLTNDKRKLSKVAVNWLNSNIAPADEIEEVLGVDINNLLFLRQLLKLRVYNATGNQFFYPFRVALYMVSNYRNVPQQEFLTLIHLIQPTFDENKIKDILDSYRSVRDGTKTFSDFLDINFPECVTNINVETLFTSDIINKEEFNQVFVNRKTTDSQKVYYKFVSNLINFKKNKTKSNLRDLLDVSSDTRVKKAFGFGKAIFIKKMNVAEFLIANKDDDLLFGSSKDIYDRFVLSKKDDIVREYKDMTKRTLNLTGIIDFSNGLVNATNQDVIKAIFSSIPLSGNEDYLSYEGNLEGLFYQDISLVKILNLQSASILKQLKIMFGVDSTMQLKNAVTIQKELKFRNFINTEFPREKILEILPLFSTRDDIEIQKQVSEFATVPTIYEYIMAITWYYLSSEEFYITESLNLTLDGNMRPLSHAAGGEGDIVIRYRQRTLMLEVTLMNRQAQRRGEWEPVLRHATNLTVDEHPRDVTTLFIADELDDNTINIWRAVASVPLKSSNKDKYAEFVKIFPLTNAEIIKMMEDKKDERKLLEAIDDSYLEFSGKFDLNWRDDILFKSIGDC